MNLFFNIGLHLTHIEQQKKSVKFPQCLKNIANKDYTVLLRIKEVNIVDHFQVYWATNICEGFVDVQHDIIEDSVQMQPENSQVDILLQHQYKEGFIRIYTDNLTLI